MDRIIKKVFTAVFSAAYCVSLLGGETQLFYESENAAAVFKNASFSTGLPEFRHIAGASPDEIEPITPTIPISKEIALSDDLEELPKSFDMRSASGMTSVKDQSIYGTCWAHSSAAAAESGLLDSEPTIDLSELHTAYMAYSGGDQIDSGDDSVDDILNRGGSVSVAANLWAQWIGPVSEDKLPYSDADKIKEYDLESLKKTSDYHLENVYNFDYDYDRSNFNEINNLIKQFIYEGNAVDVSFQSDQSVYNSGFASTCSLRIPRFANHAVTITGWDDDFSAEKFVNTPEGNGAWLVKNSWGSDYGDVGYFWISYYDKTLCDFGVYDLAGKDNYDRNYQHDSFIVSNYFSAHDDGSNSPSYMANIFTAADTEQIEAVSAYFANPGTEYEITVYTDLEDPNVPSSGTPHSITKGTSDITGYRTIELSENVPVEANERFSVAVKMYCPQNAYTLPFESCLYAEKKEEGTVKNITGYVTKEQIEEYTHKGESFISPNGTDWEDAVSEPIEYDDEQKEAVLSSIKYQLFDGLEEGRDDELIAKMEEVYEDYCTSFENADLCMIVGNASLKAFASKTASVDFSHDSGAVPYGESISLSVKDGREILVSVNGSDYEPYTSPISVTGETKISATADKNTFTERTYRPASAELFSLGYSTRAAGYAPLLKYAERISASEYVIRLNESESTLSLCPVTNAAVILDGQTIEANKMYSLGDVGFGSKTVELKLSKEKFLDNNVKLTIIKSPVTIDLETETVKFTGADTLYTKDGTKINDGDNVGKYAGEILTAEVGGEKITVNVPERSVLPTMTIDYASETLGFIPNETAELLLIAQTTGEDDAQYLTAESRLVDGAWINSGMIMNKGIMIFPGEELSFKLAAGGGKFASEPVKYSIPEAPQPPKQIPAYTLKNGVVTFIDPSVDAAVIKESSDEKNNEIMEKLMIADNEKFAAIARKRAGGEDFTKYIGAEWNSGTEIGFYEPVLIRYAATNESFASAAVYAEHGLRRKGDADGNGILDSRDAQLVLRHSVLLASKKDGIYTDDNYFADMNDDKMIDSKDAQLILNKSASSY